MGGLPPMRPFLIAAAAAVLTAGIAAAQYKMPPPPAPGQNPGGVQIAPNPNVQMSFPSQQDDLASARRIPRDEAMKMVKEGKAIYIDVRGKDSYDMDHIPGAISIPLSEIITRLREIPPHKFLITYCA
jgi:Rhodanese-like domain